MRAKSGIFWHMSIKTVFVLVISFLLWRGGSSISIFIEYKNILLTMYALFIIGPLWIAYGRLNGLDSSDGLKPTQSKAVNDFAIWAKRILLSYFAASVAFIVLSVVIFVAGDAFVRFKSILFSISISILVVFFLTAVFRIIEILFRVERTLSSVSGWKLEQKERNRQVDGLRKARAEKKLVPDDNLLRYREMYIDDDSHFSRPDADASGEIAAKVQS